MPTLIKAQASKAKTDYHDDSAEWLECWIDSNRPLLKTGLKFSEYRAIAKLKANNWLIKKGDLYVRQWVKAEDGTTYRFRTVPLILRICIKHKIYG